VAERLWILTAFFNPTNTALRVQNYRRFRDHLLAQGGHLLTIEMAFRDDPFQLQAADAHRLIHVRADSVMWQKERLLNIGLDHLPDDCEAIAWVDCDVLFTNPTWIHDARQRLESYPVVQPYEFAVRLGRRSQTMDLTALPLGPEEAQKDVGCGFRVAQGAHRTLSAPDRETLGHCGFAWCGRRAIFQRHRLYDRAILGSGDLYMAAAFLNLSLDRELPTAPMRSDYQRWARALYPDVQGRLSYVPGALLHLWHGSRGHRFYASRQRILARCAFDPGTDLTLNRDRCWEWASTKPALHQAVRRYFSLRNEDGNVWRFARAALRDPVFVGHALLGRWRALGLGWLRRHLPGLYRQGIAMRETWCHGR